MANNCYLRKSWKSLITNAHPEITLDKINSITFGYRLVPSPSYEFQVTFLGAPNAYTDTATDDGMDICAYCVKNSSNMYDIYISAYYAHTLYLPEDSQGLFSCKNDNGDSNLASITFNYHVSSYAINVVTTSCNNMGSMFYGNSKLTNLNLLNFNTNNVQYMNNMFTGCSSLINLDLSSFNTSSVRSTLGMFSNCHKLTNLNLKIKTTNLINVSKMFENCYELLSVDMSEFIGENITTSEDMLKNCYKLENLDLSQATLTSLTNTAGMLAECSFQTIKTPKSLKTGITIQLPGIYLNSSNNEITVLDSSNTSLTLNRKISETSNRIRILRGYKSALNTASNSSKILPDGQPLFDKTNRYLYIGDGQSQIKDLKSLNIEGKSVLGTTTGITDTTDRQPDHIFEENSNTVKNTTNVQNVNFASVNAAKFGDYIISKVKSIWHSDTGLSISTASNTSNITITFDKNLFELNKKYKIKGYYDPDSLLANYHSYFEIPVSYISDIDINSQPILVYISKIISDTSSGVSRDLFPSLANITIIDVNKIKFNLNIVFNTRDNVLNKEFYSPADKIIITDVYEVVE